MSQKVNSESKEIQIGTVYMSIAQRLADGLLTDSTPTDLRASQTNGSGTMWRKAHESSLPQSQDRFHMTLPSAPPSR